MMLEIWVIAANKNPKFLQKIFLVENAHRKNPKLKNCLVKCMELAKIVVDKATNNTPKNIWFLEYFNSNIIFSHANNSK